MISSQLSVVSSKLPVVSYLNDDGGAGANAAGSADVPAQDNDDAAGSSNCGLLQELREATKNNPLYVLSGPTAVGKGTLSTYLRLHDP
ncbi:MAG: hypothetical protein LBC43_03095, partial [Bifidobacteriaceae bacterium]|nr:hypothetical protein [Bifidobacteriaceae bacterium]